MEFVRLVNRTNRTLKGTWDGRHYDITPGEHAFPELHAAKFKEQNPVMGSADPYAWPPVTQQYYIGIVEYGDPTDPIEMTSAPQRFDRTQLVGLDARPVEVRDLSGLYTRGAVAQAAPKFEKP